MRKSKLRSWFSLLVELLDNILHKPRKQYVTRFYETFVFILYPALHFLENTCWLLLDVDRMGCGQKCWNELDLSSSYFWSHATVQFYFDSILKKLDARHKYSYTWILLVLRNEYNSDILRSYILFETKITLLQFIDSRKPSYLYFRKALFSFRKNILH